MNGYYNIDSQLTRALNIKSKSFVSHVIYSVYLSFFFSRSFYFVYTVYSIQVFCFSPLWQVSLFYTFVRYWCMILSSALYQWMLFVTLASLFFPWKLKLHEYDFYFLTQLLYLLCTNLSHKAKLLFIQTHFLCM